EAEPAAQVAVARIAFAALAARRQPCREPDLVGCRGPIHRLQEEFEIEREFQFADHHHRRIAVRQPDDIAATDLALDGEAELFEEAFDGKVERSLQGGAAPQSPARSLRL